MWNLENKVCIVTGGASGIGLAAVKSFLGKGGKVVIGDYNVPAGLAVEKDLKEKGADVLFNETNVADEKSLH